MTVARSVAANWWKLNRAKDKKMHRELTKWQEIKLQDTHIYQDYEQLPYFDDF